MSHPVAALVRGIQITIAGLIGLCTLIALAALIWMFMDDTVSHWISVARVMIVVSFFGIAWHLYQTFFGTDSSDKNLGENP